MQLEQMLDECKEGDPLAWEALVREFQPRVYGLARYYLKDPEDCRDLTQEVFIRLYDHLDSCTDGEMLLPWIIRITRNAAIDQLRRRKVRPPARDIPAEEAFDLRQSGPNPAEIWEARSCRRLFRYCLSKMTFLNRQVLELKEFEELPLEEIAERLEVPVGTIKSRCHRARQELGTHLRALMGESPRKLCDLEESP